MNGRTWLMAGVLACVVAGGAHARPPEDRGRQTGSNTSESTASRESNLARITIDRETARRWAGELRLGGQAALPPGIRRNLARGKPLPPGIAKRTLPTPYLSRLPALDGYDWTMAGRDLVLVQAATGIIADVLADVFD